MIVNSYYGGMQLYQFEYSNYVQFFAFNFIVSIHFQ